MTVAFNAQINMAKPESLPDRIAGRMRRRMFECFLVALSPSPHDTILDVGATSDQTLSHSNYVVSWYPHKQNITTVGIDDASFLESRYPGVTFRKASGLNLPFPDNSFDFVHSSAVLEHVGSRENQTKFIGELARVSRKGFFLTTPNRWFPVEFHSLLPFVHWLPRSFFWGALRMTGRGELADESVLNLLDRQALAEAASSAGVSDVHIDSVAIGGWATNLLLIQRKEPQGIVAVAVAAGSVPEPGRMMA
jgi:ubiquinone/menaquinone biosynthesis C-methylase UbiE